MKKHEVVDTRSGEVLLQANFIPPQVRHPSERKRVITPVNGESMTHQSHLEGCSIKNIIDRYDRTGVLPPSRRSGQFVDCTGLQDDLTSLAIKASDVVNKTGKAIESEKAKRAKASADRQVELESEIAKLRSEQAKAAGVSPASP